MIRLPLVSALLLSFGASGLVQAEEPGKEPAEAAPAPGDEGPAREQPPAPEGEQPASEQPASEQPAEPAPPSEQQTLIEQPAPEAEPAPSQAAAPEATGLDARVRRLSDTVARALKRLPGDHRDQTFAVLPLDEVGPESKRRRLGVIVADMVMTNLARDHRMALVERGQLGAILDEQVLGQTGAIPEGQAAEVGKLAGATALVVGTVADVGPSFKVSLRVVNAVDAKVIATAEAALPKEELIAVAADSVVLKSKAGAAFRSLVAPGWGQSYNGESAKAYLVGGAVGSMAGLTLLTLIAAGTTHLLYVGWTPECTTILPNCMPAGVARNKQTQAEAVQAWRLGADVLYLSSLAVGGITAALWGAGVADAYLSGVDVDSLDQALVRE